MSACDFISSKIKVSGIPGMGEFLRCFWNTSNRLRSFLIILRTERSPTGIDRHKSGQYAFGDDLKFWQNAFAPILGVVKHLLYRDEIITADDRLVMIVHPIYRSLSLVLHRSVIVKIRRECFPSSDVPAMTFIAQHLHNRAARPVILSGARLDLKHCQLVSDLLTGVAIEVHKEDQPDDRCFFLVNHQMTIFIVCIAKELWGQILAEAKSHLH